MTYPPQQQEPHKPPVMHGYDPHPPRGDWAPPRRGRIHPLAWAALAVALVALAGVGWLVYQRETAPVGTIANPETVDAFASAAAAQAALPACKDVFLPGKVIDAKKAMNGCKGPAGNTIFVGSFDCTDGRKLFQVDANTGAPAGWGFGNGKYRATKEAAADPAYSKAYGSCND